MPLQTQMTVARMTARMELHVLMESMTTHVTALRDLKEKTVEQVRFKVDNVINNHRNFKLLLKLR